MNHTVVCKKINLKELAPFVLILADGAVGDGQPYDSVGALLHRPQLVLHLVVEVRHRASNGRGVRPTC